MIKNVSIFEVIGACFSEFKTHFKYYMKLILLWAFLPSLFFVVLSFYLAGNMSEQLQMLQTSPLEFMNHFADLSYGIFEGIVTIATTIILVGLLYKKVLSAEQNAIIISFKEFFGYILKILQLVLTTVIFSLPIFLLTFLIDFFNSDVLGIILSILLFVYVCFFVYLLNKASLVMVNFYDTNRSIMDVIKLKFGFKNALKYIVALIFYAIIIFFIFVLISALIGISAVFFGEVAVFFGFAIGMIFFLLASVSQFYILIFQPVFYRLYVKDALNA